MQLYGSIANQEQWWECNPHPLLAPSTPMAKTIFSEWTCPTMTMAMQVTQSPTSIRPMATASETVTLCPVVCRFHRWHCHCHCHCFSLLLWLTLKTANATTAITGLTTPSADPFWKRSGPKPPPWGLFLNCTINLQWQQRWDIIK